MKDDAMEKIYEEIRGCRACRLHEHRTHTVPGQGPADASLMLVGEGPGQEEDRTGIPFVGPAGRLLDKILASVGFDRKSVYVTNVVKCRPPGNRTPRRDEIETCCSRFLTRQIEIVKPALIVSLGNPATKYFLGFDSPGITRLRGRIFQWNGIPLVPMYHPSYLLRNDSREPGSPKWQTWQDIRMVRQLHDELLGESGE